MLENIVASLLFFSIVMLAFLILTNPMKVNKRANKWFGVFIVILGSFWLDEVLSITGGKTVSISSIPMIRFIHFLSPTALYFSILLFTNPSYKFDRKSSKHLIAPIVYLIILITESVLGNYYDVLLIALLLCNSIIYSSWSYLKIRQHKKNIKLFSSNPEDYNLKWLEQIIIGFVLITLLFSLFTIFFYQHQLNIFMYLSMLVTVYFTAYNSLKQKEIYPINEAQTEEVISITEEQDEEDEKRKIVPDQKLIELKSELNTLMQTQEPYLNSELNLINLSELLNISPHILSYVINTGFNVNFPQFVNKYRVEKAKQLLKDPEQSKKLSILGIAYESGFNSKTVFNTTFKKTTGQTPSEFKKNRSDS